MPKSLTDPKESATRKRLDAILHNLKWRTDETKRDCNVYTERAKTIEQNRKLAGCEPDYILYESGTDKPIAVIEAKRSGQSLTKALEQAVDSYAKPLNIPIVFVADGAIIESYDCRVRQPLKLDGEIVTTLLGEKPLLRFVEEGASLFTPDVVRHTKQELIKVFGEANDLLRQEGLRAGIERFTEFANLLFLKLISEIEEERERDGERRVLDKRYCWEAFSRRDPADMLDYINDTILPRLVQRYNHSSDVFQNRLKIDSPETLKRIIDKLSKLTLLDTDSDVKGDAFEYFLKNSVTVGNDLGEYFTPRHIVRLMVDLVDPRYKEQIYDPACGTGGFLIQAFRHVKGKVRQTAVTKRALENDTVFGRELTGTAKIAKMNMIIIGDGHNNITQMDSLKHPVKAKYDIILTNYPFSQRTDYGHLYGLKSENANAVFLKHVIDALRKSGRAAVVVPEGLLFDMEPSCLAVRKILLETCDLEAVIGLDQFAFRPYTGQPTSILFFTKGRPTQRVWFFEVKDDGFERSTRKLGRRVIDANDIPLLRQSWADKSDSERSFCVETSKIATHGYRLSLDEYRTTSTHADWVPLGGRDGLCDVLLGGTPSTKDRSLYGGEHPWVTIGDITEASGRPITDTKQKLTDRGVKQSSVKLVPKGTVLLSFKLSPGKVGITGRDLYTNEAIAALVPRTRDRILPRYLYYVLQQLDYSEYIRKASKGRTMNKASVETIRIPLPSVKEQAKIITKLDAHEEKILKAQAEVERLLKSKAKALTNLVAK